MKILLGIIAALSLIASFVIVSTAQSAMQEIVGAVVGINFTLCLIGISVLNTMEAIGIPVVTYLTKRVESEKK